MGLKDSFVLNPQVFTYCLFCYKEVALNSYELHNLGYDEETVLDPDPDLLMEEFEKKLLQEGWITAPNTNKPMCGECARAFEQLDDMLAN